MNTKELKPYFLLITYAAALILLVTHFEWLLGQVGWVVSVTMPFIIGFIIAFTLNRPYLFVRDTLLRPIMKGGEAKEERVESQASILAIILVYAVLFFVVGKLVGSVVPELIVTIQNFSANLSTYIEDFTPLVEGIFTTLRLDESMIQMINTYWQEFISSLGSFFNALLPALVNFSMGAATSIYNVFSGLIISVYLLLGKRSSPAPSPSSSTPSCPRAGPIISCMWAMWPTVPSAASSPGRSSSPALWAPSASSA